MKFPICWFDASQVWFKKKNPVSCVYVDLKSLAVLKEHQKKHQCWNNTSVKIAPVLK